MLNNKSAIISGPLGGIGFATVQALARQGCNITLNGFASQDIIDQRVTEIAVLCRPSAEDIDGSDLPVDGAWIAGR